MTSTWATFTCSLVFLVVISGVCSIEVADASGEEAVSLRDDMTPSQRSAASLQSSENREPPANGCMTGGNEARRTSQQSTTRIDNDEVDDDAKSSSESDEKNDKSGEHKNNHNDMKKRRKTSEKSSEDRSSDSEDDDGDANNDDDAADDDNDKKKNKGGTGQRTRETVGVTFAVLLTVGVMFTVTAVLVFLYCYFTHRPDTKKLEHRSHGSACNTYSLPPIPVGSQPRPPESSPVATPLGEASSRQTISTEDVYELVDETEYLHPSHSGWVPVKKPRDQGVGCQQYTVLQRRASRSDGGDGVSAVKDRRTENHAYTHLHQPGDSHNDLEHESKSAPDVVRLIRRRTNCKSLEPLHSGSPASTGDTSDSSSSVDTPTSEGYSLQKPVMEVYPRATADTAVMAPAADTAYMIPAADTAVMTPAADTAYMIPAADTAVMAPAAVDRAYMIPAADTAVMAPAVDRAYMIPAADTAVMAPTAGITYFVSAADNGQGPAADRGGDDMDAAAEVYADPASGQSCSC